MQVWGDLGASGSSMGLEDAFGILGPGYCQGLESKDLEFRV